MGRELKRMPLNFEWEIGKLWSGYINPHEVHNCSHCDGMGYSKEYRQLEEKWYSFDNENYKPNPFREGFRYNANAWCNNLTKEDVKALLDGGRLRDLTNNGNDNPTPEQVNEWNLKTIGHDSINAWLCIKARLKREKKPYKCPKCNGTGENWQHPKAKRLYNNWKSYSPPAGEGYQLWSTTTEGHPMTPVFKTLDELCEYCEKENVSIFGSKTASKEEWLGMLGEDFVAYKEGNTIFI